MYKIKTFVLKNRPLSICVIATYNTMYRQNEFKISSCVKINKSDQLWSEELFMTYRGKMYAVAFAILHNEAQAEDSVESNKTKRFLHCAVKSAATFSFDEVYAHFQKELSALDLKQEYHAH